MSESKYGPQGKMALWRAEPGKKQVFQGNIELSPELIKEIINQYQGNPMKLNLIGFKSNSDHPKAPAYSGFASLPAYTGNETAQSEPAPKNAPEGVAGAADYSEIPF
ncbi:hypothetical protein D0962_34885 [Leptolyngbyaceae cyanobacterium CCMR0082]|uniref:Uncharacterized protein n=1 Tax=Adonisia turfae CCMR0082 TaxID=2304604 RepID=A0A6M0SIT0_9CYAN|nr:hypothetical protein [Adonisia turfae]NEZ67881.1 hypothetical protein [Adonisia turfae CCMR0082]